MLNLSFDEYEALRAAYNALHYWGGSGIVARKRGFGHVVPGLIRKGLLEKGEMKALLFPKKGDSKTRKYRAYVLTPEGDRRIAMSIDPTLMLAA